MLVGPSVVVTVAGAVEEHPVLVGSGVDGSVVVVPVLVSVGFGQLAGAVGVVLLVGSATALAGPIAFVGLVVPHAVRALVGGDHRWLLPLSALLAPVLLLAADVMGRVVAPPGEVQAGIMTAVVGAPVFVALVRRRRVGSL